MRIPILHAEPYMAHDIRTFPVKNPTGEGFLRIYHNVKTVSSTVSDELFFPTHCLGIHPSVCQAGPSYARDRHGCLRGIIEGDSKLIQQCPIEYRKEIYDDEVIQSIGSNRYLVHCNAEDYKYRCEGRRPVKGRWNDGTYVIQLDPGCVLDADSFQLEGLLYTDISVYTYRYL